MTAKIEKAGPLMPGASMVAAMLGMLRPDADPIGMLTCLTLTPDEQLEFLTSPPAEDNEKGAAFVGRLFAMVAWICRRITPLDPVTGEYGVAVQTTLISATGEKATFSSNGIFQALQKIVAFKGAGPWKQPINVEISEQQTRAGRPFFTMSYVGKPKKEGAK